MALWDCFKVGFSLWAMHTVADLVVMGGVLGLGFVWGFVDGGKGLPSETHPVFVILGAATTVARMVITGWLFLNYIEWFFI